MMQNRPTKNATSKVGTYGLVGNFVAPIPVAGYHAREDATLLAPNTLVSPSQNILMGVSGRLASVLGYVLDGPGSTAIDSGILSNFDYTNFKGDVRNIRAGFLSSLGNDGRIQYRYVTGTTTNWVDLMKSRTTVRMNFTQYWDTTELKRLLLFVDGSNNIFEWNGAVTTLASASNSTGYVGVVTATPVSGGTGYVAGDILTLAGGTATVTVTAVTGSTVGAITGISIGSQSGNFYVVGDVLTLSGGTGGTLTVTSVAGNGAITGVSITTTGTGYSAGYTTPTGGSGSGANNFQITSVGGQAISTVALTSTGSGYSNGTVATTGGTGTGATIAITTVYSNAIVKQGTNTWYQEGFYQTRNQSVTMGGLTYTYSIAIGNTLIGINLDPTVPGLAVGSIIHQTPVTNTLASMQGVLAMFAPTVIGCGRTNQVYLGSSTSNNLYMSKVNNFLDYRFTTPTRVVGEGDLLPLQAPPTAFISQEVRTDSLSYDLYVSQGTDYWSIIRSTLSADLTTETLQNIVLKVSPLQGSRSQRLTGKMKDQIMFVDNKNVASFLGFMTDQFVPIITDFSFPIINDMMSYDFTDASMYYTNNFVYIAVPKEGIIRIYNMTNQSLEASSAYKVEEDITQQPWYWEVPITYPIAGFYFANGNLYGHSYTTSESYLLFSGGSFNGQDIDANATFAFDDKGDRTQSKGSTEIYVEGYIQQNTKLSVTVGGDLDAFMTSQTVTIDGNDNTIVAYGSGAHSLGKNTLGSRPLGGTDLDTSALPAWFHVIKTYDESPCYLEQISFSTKGVDLYWELLSFGTNSQLTNEGNNSITQ